jgi:4,5-dihydroxyphthalate decarboxylase
MARDVLTLRAAFGPYPHALPLKDGRIARERVRFEHLEIDPINRAFRPMVNDLVYDVSEMALVTHMLGQAMRRPLRGIPVVMMRQSAHRMLHCPVDSSLRSPRELEGRTVGVRAYTQTTGTWLRGIVQDQFGVDLSALQWVTFEDAHVDGFVDPPNCARAPAGKTLLQMTLDGEVDAAVGLEPHPRLRILIPDVEQAEAAFAPAPINHVVVVRESLAREYPWLTHELFGMFCAARELAPGEAAPYGLEPNRPAIERLAHYAYQQGITSRPFTPDELFPAL